MYFFFEFIFRNKNDVIQPVKRKIENNDEQVKRIKKEDEKNKPRMIKLVDIIKNNNTSNEKKNEKPIEENEKINEQSNKKVDSILSRLGPKSKPINIEKKVVKKTKHIEEVEKALESIYIFYLVCKFYPHCTNKNCKYIHDPKILSTIV